MIDAYQLPDTKLVFISEGASWIKNWVENAYPNALSILDYYHAAEHLHPFADIHFKDEDKKKKWTDRQKDLQLQSKWDTVIKNMAKRCDRPEAQNHIGYYNANRLRMD